MEHPQNQQGDRKSEDEGSQWSVTEAAARGEAEEIFEVGSKRANHQSRRDKAGASERDGRGGVGGGEGHIYIIYQGLRAGSTRDSHVRDRGKILERNRAHPVRGEDRSPPGRSQFVFAN